MLVFTEILILLDVPLYNNPHQSKEKSQHLLSNFFIHVMCIQNYEIIIEHHLLNYIEKTLN
jgi:hypothetical protein